MKGFFYNEIGQELDVEPLVLSNDWDKAIDEVVNHINGSKIIRAKHFALVSSESERVLIVK